MDRSDFAFLGGVMLGFLLLFYGIVSGVNLLAQVSCEATSKKMAVEHQYSFMTGCLIKTPDGWFPLEQMRRLP